ALGERGEHRGQVAGVLDRRTGGDPDRLLELGRDDHRERGLAQAGRAGEENVVRWRAPATGCLEDEPELLTDLGLAGEVGEPPWPEGGLDDPVLLRAAAVDDPRSGVVGAVALPGQVLGDPDLGAEAVL